MIFMPLSQFVAVWLIRKAHSAVLVTVPSTLKSGVATIYLFIFFLVGGGGGGGGGGSSANYSPQQLLATLKKWIVILTKLSYLSCVTPLIIPCLFV